MSLITEMLQESCRSYANKPALRHKLAGRWVEHSYAKIWSISDHVASGLVEWGLEDGDRGQPASVHSKGAAPLVARRRSHRALGSHRRKGLCEIARML